MNLFMRLVLVPFFTCIASHAFCQDSTAQQSLDKELYQSKKKAAKGMIIGGAVSMGVGLIALGAAATVATAELVPAILGQEPQYEEETTAGAVAGTVLFFGGAGVLIAGLVTNGKANRMMEGHMSISSHVPPAFVGNRHVGQSGLTLSWQFNTRQAK